MGLAIIIFKHLKSHRETASLDWVECMAMGRVMTLCLLFERFRANKFKVYSFSESVLRMFYQLQRDVAAVGGFFLCSVLVGSLLA